MPDENESPEKSMEYDQDPNSDGEEQNSSPHDEVRAAQERYVRLAAEFENYKKRAQKDQDEYRKYSNERLLKELLPVIDNLQRALQHGRVSKNQEGVLEGVELTSKKALEILSGSE